MSHFLRNFSKSSKQQKIFNPSIRSYLCFLMRYSGEMWRGRKYNIEKLLKKQKIQKKKNLLKLKKKKKYRKCFYEIKLFFF